MDGEMTSRRSTVKTAGREVTAAGLGGPIADASDEYGAG
jgi:hypothetical protein